MAFRSATTKILRSPWSTRWDAKFIASSFTAILPTTRQKSNVTTITSPVAGPDNFQIDTVAIRSLASSRSGSSTGGLAI